MVHPSTCRNVLLNPILLVALVCCLIVMLWHQIVPVWMNNTIYIEVNHSKLDFKSLWTGHLSKMTDQRSTSRTMPESKGVQQSFALGLLSINSGNYEEAVEQFQVATQDERRAASLWLGMAIFRLGQIERLQYVWTQRDIGYLLMKADAVMHQRDYPFARDIYRMVVAARPEDISMWERLFYTQIVLQDWSGAQATLERIRELTSVTSLLQLRLFVATEQDAAAIAVAPIAIRECQQDPRCLAEAYKQSAIAAYRVGDGVQALEWLHLAEQAADGSDPMIGTLLSDFYWGMNKNEEALDALLEYQRRFPLISEFPMRAGHAYLRLGEIKDAEAAFQQAIAANQDSESLRIQAASWLEEFGYHEQARQVRR